MGVMELTSAGRILPATDYDPRSFVARTEQFGTVGPSVRSLHCGRSGCVACDRGSPSLLGTDPRCDDIGLLQQRLLRTGARAWGSRSGYQARLAVPLRFASIRASLVSLFVSSLALWLGRDRAESHTHTMRYSEYSLALSKKR